MILTIGELIHVHVYNDTDYRWVNTCTCTMILTIGRVNTCTMILTIGGLIHVHVQ